MRFEVLYPHEAPGVHNVMPFCKNIGYVHGVSRLWMIQVHNKNEDLTYSKLVCSEGPLTTSNLDFIPVLQDLAKRGWKPTGYIIFQGYCHVSKHLHCSVFNLLTRQEFYEMAKSRQEGVL